MEKIQVAPIPESQQSFLIQMTRDFRAALSYVSFYSADSPFVVQAVQKLHRNFQRLLQAVERIVFHAEGGKLFVNDTNFSDLVELFKLLQEKGLKGVEMTFGLTDAELGSWLKRVTLPVARPEDGESDSVHIRLLPVGTIVEVQVEAPQPSYDGETPIPVIPVTEEVPQPVLAANETPVLSLRELMNPESPSLSPAAMMERVEAEAKTNEALLSFVAEAWQYSQMQKKNLGNSPEMAALAGSFDKLFERLLDRMEKSSPEFKDIYHWFTAPRGELLENHVILSMYPLLEVAIKNGWTAVLFDPTTEGLLSECLAYWGANGKLELVEKTVICISEKLSGDPLERQLALAHLMDARPWVKNPEVLEKVLDRLNALLATETSPHLYQTGLLLAWDLLDVAMESGKGQPVLTLVATLHFHADEEISAFPERSHIARFWLFERSTPKLIRHLARCASNAGQLGRFALLGEMAAPLLLKDFFTAKPAEKPEYFKWFGEIKEPVRSALAEWLAEAKNESEVRLLIPILRVCGTDAALSLQVCSWVARGSRELKLDLIGLIEEANDPAGGPALRLAVFDDSQEIAALAARIIGKIRFTPGLKVLLKAAKIREERFPDNEVFLLSVCQSLGDLGQAEAFPFLQDIARKKPLLRGKNFSFPVRLEAIVALTKLHKPEVWHFLETLTSEKNAALQEALEKIIHERTGSISS